MHGQQEYDNQTDKYECTCYLVHSVKKLLVEEVP
jgi:hypothetical protein